MTATMKQLEVSKPDENTPESVESSSDEDFDMTTDEADAHFLK